MRFFSKIQSAVTSAISLLICIGLTISLSSCSVNSNKEIKLLTNAWIGYSPLFYAKEKGWLKPYNIKLSNVVSLGESLAIFENSDFDGFTGTQYEYLQAKKYEADLIPIMMFDRSAGGDMVMGNQSIAQLRLTLDTINVYLEMNSVNYLVFQDFIKHHHLNNKKFNFINKDQLKIMTELEMLGAENKLNAPPIIVVTYEPYNHRLEKQGFETLDSTANGLNLLVVDALYTTQQHFQQHRQQFIALKKIINQAIGDLKTQPKNYYETVKPYLDNMSYIEFRQSLETIEWLNESISDTLTIRILESELPTGHLL